jgi:serine/threonine protein kinase
VTFPTNGGKPSKSLSRRKVETSAQPFGKYTLLARLATGGMGEILLGRLGGVAGFEKLVVIKRLLPHLAEDRKFVHMLLEEARIAARLTHPNICQVYEVGEVHGQYYIAMEHLDGVPLSRLIRKMAQTRSALDLRIATGIFHQACEGLHHAHDLKGGNGVELGLVHRDVSPANLFLTADGIVKILDFGIAKTRDGITDTKTGTLKGKYPYMSPEQVRGEPLDRRSDVFSLGVCMFEALTNRRLFRRDSDFQTLRAITEGPIPSVRDYRAEVSTQLAAVIGKALARDREDRFATAADLAEAIDEAAKDIGGTQRSSAIGKFIDSNFTAELNERRNFIAEAATRSHEQGPDLPLAPQGVRETVTAVSGVISSAVAKRRAATGARAGTVPAVLVAVAAVAGLGGGGYAVWRSQSISSAPVVVYSGAVTPERTAAGRPVPLLGGSEPEAAASPGSVDARASQAADSAAPNDPNATATRSDKAGRRTRAQTPPPPARGDTYSRIFAAKQAQIAECFNTYAESVEGTPKIGIKIDIDKEGGVAASALSPSSLDATPLGECINKVARRAHFGPQDNPVTIRIPLQVRRR